jgi:hypothetical protein
MAINQANEEEAKPVIVRGYNVSMGVVDLKDQKGTK